MGISSVTTLFLQLAKDDSRLLSFCVSRKLQMTQSNIFFLAMVFVFLINDEYSMYCWWWVLLVRFLGFKTGDLLRISCWSKYAKLLPSSKYCSYTSSISYATVFPTINIYIIFRCYEIPLLFVKRLLFPHYIFLNPITMHRPTKLHIFYYSKYEQ